MHMADALLSAGVGGAMCAVSAAGIGYTISKVKEDALFEKNVPLMAVSGAFVFAAQMINITIPFTGSSGHIGGGMLLAGMLGGFPALLSIAAVLIIQCLFFADGGLIALGCNIFNMGIIPCLIVYPLLFRPLLKKGINARSISFAAIVSSIVGLQLGAFFVVLQTQASGITALPFGAFALLMQPIHLAIGVVEGIVTAAVLCFVHRARPEILESAVAGTPAGTPAGGGAGYRKAVFAFAAAALVVGGVLSLFASSYPDGLEWAIEKTMAAELEAVDEGQKEQSVIEKTAGAELEVQGALPSAAAQIQEATALMPDYAYKSAAEGGLATGTSVAGIAGGALTFLFAGGAGIAITAVKKAKKRRAGT